MPTIRVETQIAAPIELVFDLARSIDLHVATQTRYRERAVAGRTSGLIGPGESVTWEATHFGVRQRLAGEIVAFDRPRHFRDAMTRGAFARLVHDHHFEATHEGTRMAGTRMIDILEFASPLGPLGWLADRIAVTRHMRRLLVERGAMLRDVAEDPVRAGAYLSP